MPSLSSLVVLPKYLFHCAFDSQFSDLKFRTQVTDILKLVQWNLKNSDEGVDMLILSRDGVSYQNSQTFLQ